MSKGAFDLFSTNKEFEQGGIWLDYGQFRIKVARAGGFNRAFALRMDAVMKPYRRAIESETMDVALADRLLRTIYVDTVVKAWEVRRPAEGEEPGDDDPWVAGMDNPDDDDVLLEFNKDNVTRTFELLPDLFRDVREQATKSALFRKDIAEVEAKN